MANNKTPFDSENPASGIVKKKSTSKTTGEYESWDAFKQLPGNDNQAEAKTAVPSFRDKFDSKQSSRYSDTPTLKTRTQPQDNRKPSWFNTKPTSTNFNFMHTGLKNSNNNGENNINDRYDLVIALKNKNEKSQLETLKQLSPENIKNIIDSRSNLIRVFDVLDTKAQETLIDTLSANFIINLYKKNFNLKFNYLNKDNRTDDKYDNRKQFLRLLAQKELNITAKIEKPNEQNSNYYSHIGTEGYYNEETLGAHLTKLAPIFQRIRPD